MSVLEQNHNAFDDFPVLDTVLRGNTDFYAVKTEMDAIYAKEDFSDADGERVGELQIQFEEMNGWNAESDAAALLSNLGINEGLHYTQMADLDGVQKVGCCWRKPSLATPMCSLWMSLPTIWTMKPFCGWSSFWRTMTIP